MKEIPLTQGKIALVDDEDYEWLNKIKWHFAKGSDGNDGYAKTKSNKKPVSMHKMIMNTPPSMEVDHIDRNRLNNQRSNLRIATRLQNSANRRVQRNNKSGYKGASFIKKTSRWRASLKAGDKYAMCASFKSAEEAAIAYDVAAKAIFGEFAFLNFPKAS